MARTPVPATHTLADGTRVRLRLPHASDLSRLAELARRLGADELKAARIPHFDPRARIAVVAAAWLGGREELVGCGALDLVDGAQPDGVLADEVAAPGLTALLHEALTATARRKVA